MQIDHLLQNLTNEDRIEAINQLAIIGLSQYIRHTDSRNIKMKYLAHLSDAAKSELKLFLKPKKNNDIRPGKSNLDTKRHSRIDSVMKYPFADVSATMTDIIQGNIKYPATTIFEMNKVARRNFSSHVFKDYCITKDRMLVSDIPSALKSLGFRLSESREKKFSILNPSSYDAAGHENQQHSVNLKQWHSVVERFYRKHTTLENSSIPSTKDYSNNSSRKHSYSLQQVNNAAGNTNSIDFDGVITEQDGIYENQQQDPMDDSNPWINSKPQTIDSPISSLASPYPVPSKAKRPPLVPHRRTGKVVMHPTPANGSSLRQATASSTLKRTHSNRNTSSGIDSSATAFQVRQDKERWRQAQLANKQAYHKMHYLQQQQEQQQRQHNRFDPFDPQSFQEVDSERNASRRNSASNNQAANNRGAMSTSPPPPPASCSSSTFSRDSSPLPYSNRNSTKASNAMQIASQFLNGPLGKSLQEVQYNHHSLPNSQCITSSGRSPSYSHRDCKTNANTATGANSESLKINEFIEDNSNSNSSRFSADQFPSDHDAAQGQQARQHRWTGLRGGWVADFSSFHKQSKLSNAESRLASSTGSSHSQPSGTSDAYTLSTSSGSSSPRVSTATSSSSGSALGWKTGVISSSASSEDTYTNEDLYEMGEEDFSSQEVSLFT